MEKLIATRKYVEHIRNKEKREYAETVSLWYRRGEHEKPYANPPECTNGLGTMAEQAVRYNLREIWYEAF
jgi:hypothetical protein